MKKKIVVTGISIYTPLGKTLDENWNNLLKSESGFSVYSDITNSFNEKIVASEIKELISTEDKWIVIFNQLISGLIESGFVNVSNLKNSSLCLGTSFLGIEGANYNSTLDKYLNEIRNKYQFNNGIYINTNTCAGGNFAIQNGVNLIKSGLADMAVCGGIDIISEYLISGFLALRSLSKTESRPFSENRDGMSLGEGGALLILEEEESALKRGSRIICEYAGFGVSSDNEKITVMDKSGKGILKCIENALNDAGINNSDIDLICAHGTGTKLNDSVEAEMIKKYFSDKVYIQAFKSYFGHSMSASSAVSAGILAYNLMKQKLIKIRNLDKPLNKLKYVMNNKDADILYGINNAFGFGGINSCLIMKRHNN